jgi:hypothetical protein
MTVEFDSPDWSIEETPTGTTVVDKQPDPL